MGLQTAPPASHLTACLITQGLFTTVLFTRYIISHFQQIISTQILKFKKHILKSLNKYENHLDMAGMLELSGPEFKIIKINTLR